jgi:ABC-2 type transport system permease protein
MSAGRWLRQLTVLAAKELRQLWRDRWLFLFVVYIFTGHIFVAAGAVATELQRAALLVHDADRSAAARELVHLFRPPYFLFAGTVADAAAGQRALDDGRAALVLDIPPGFARTLTEGRAPATVQLLVDTSKASLGFLAASYSARIVAGFAHEHAARRLARAGVDAAQLPAIAAAPRVWHNPNLYEPWFATLTDLLTMMTVACILLPAAALVREKERGTIEQLLVSPLTPLQIMLAKVLAMLLVVLAGTAVSLFAIMQPVYGVPAKGSVPLLFALTALYVFANAGLGLAAATFARNSAQVGMLVLLLVVPMVMLSGAHTPLETMPGWLQELMRLSPLRYFIEIAFGILLRGAGLELLWGKVLAIAALGGALFALGLWRFRRQFG